MDCCIRLLSHTKINNKQPVESKDHPGWILMTVGILSEIIIADMCILDGLSMYCCWLPDAVPCCQFTPNSVKHWNPTHQKGCPAKRGPCYPSSMFPKIFTTDTTAGCHEFWSWEFISINNIHLKATERTVQNMFQRINPINALNYRYLNTSSKQLT